MARVTVRQSTGSGGPGLDSLEPRPGQVESWPPTKGPSHGELPRAVATLIASGAASALAVAPLRFGACLACRSHVANSWAARGWQLLGFKLLAGLKVKLLDTPP